MGNARVTVPTLTSWT